MAPKKKEKNKSTVSKTSDAPTKKSNFCWVFVSGVVVLFAVASYQIYNTFLLVPDMPDIKLDTWWGPNSSIEQDTSIRPYRVIFSDSFFTDFIADYYDSDRYFTAKEMQENLNRKFENYRSMTKVKSLNESSNYGLNSDALAQIFAHWQFQYKYRHRVRYLNKFNHFKTNIQGLDIHFIHVKPKVGPNVKVIQILLLHGWPGSIKEFYELIPLLTSEREGYDFAFEVIAPSLPGFIYSQAPVKPGLSAYQTAIMMRNLMERLGLKKFYVHGGDIGHVIGSHMATMFPNQVLGFHTSFPVNMSHLAQIAWIFSEIWQNMINGEIWNPISNKLSDYMEELGYAHLQSTKPDTIGTALQDSPIGLAAYIIDRILIFTDPSNKEKPDGGLSMFDKTDLLDNVMLYWSSGSITTSLRLFKENIKNYEVEQTFARIPTDVPTWGLRLKHELIRQCPTVLGWKFRNILGITDLDIGGHFPAFEIPVEVANDLFKAVKVFLQHSKEE